MAESPITGSQQRVLVAFASFVRLNDYSPTLRELGDLLGFTSTNAVGCLLVALKSKGYLEDRGAPTQARRVGMTLRGWCEVDGLTPGRVIPEQYCSRHRIVHFGRCIYCERAAT